MPPGLGALLLLLLLSCFSRVRPCATPQTAAHQAPPPLGFSRQEHWSGVPFPSLMRESEVAQSCPTLSDPMDCSLPGSSVHGIFQARALEWGAIAFSWERCRHHRKVSFFYCKLSQLMIILNCDCQRTNCSLVSILYLNSLLLPLESRLPAASKMPEQCLAPRRCSFG